MPNTYVDRVCPVCGTTFPLLGYLAKRDRVYCCSRSCGNRNRPVRDRFAPVEELSRLYVEEGLTLKEIADRYGVTLQAVWYHLDAAGIPRRKPPGPVLTDDFLAKMRAAHPRGDQNPRFRAVPVDEIVAAYSAGDGIEALAARFNVSTPVIVHRLRSEGVTMRPNGFPGGWRIARDGHRVQSGHELAVDDWLHDHHIPHELHPLLPFGRRQQADFLALGRYVEVWGLLGNARYAAKRVTKVANYRAHGLDLIEITSDQVLKGDFSPLAVLLG